MYAFQNIPRSDISNMRESASLKYPNSEKSIKKTLGAAEFFLINFKVFRYLMKCSSECLVKILKPLIILREIQRKSAPYFMVIRITYQPPSQW